MNRRQHRSMTYPGYSNVSTSDDKVELVTAVAVGDAANHRSSSSNIPEALGLTWTDTFYDSTEGVIAVFDVDYESYKRVLRGFKHFYVFYGVYFVVLSVNYYQEGIFDAFIMPYSITCVVLACWMILVDFNRRTRGFDSMHVAVTNEGIRKDCHKFPFGAMFRTTMVIPFEEIKSISYKRRCSSSIVTVRSSADCTSDYTYGLKDPEAFVSLVKAMMTRSNTVSVLDEESLTEK